MVAAGGLRSTGSVAVTHGPSWILPDWASSPHPLHWQADSLLLSNQEALNSLFGEKVLGNPLLLL